MTKPDIRRLSLKDTTTIKVHLHASLGSWIYFTEATLCFCYWNVYYLFFATSVWSQFQNRNYRLEECWGSLFRIIILILRNNLIGMLTNSCLSPKLRPYNYKYIPKEPSQLRLMYRMWVSTKRGDVKPSYLNDYVWGRMVSLISKAPGTIGNFLAWCCLL